MSAYDGPLRDEPLAVELHNTRYAAAGQLRDGLADDASARAWVGAIQARLPPGGHGRAVGRVALLALREAVADALRAAVDGQPPRHATLDALNAASARAPGAVVARHRRGEAPARELDFGDARREDVVIAALAADAIRLLTGPEREAIRACGAPGCVLFYLKDHPRRGWCSAGCGNRARQARHYRRVREG